MGRRGAGMKRENSHFFGDMGGGRGQTSDPEALAQCEGRATAVLREPGRVLRLCRPLLEELCWQEGQVGRGSF